MSEKRTSITPEEAEGLVCDLLDRLSEAEAKIQFLEERIEWVTRIQDARITECVNNLDRFWRWCLDRILPPERNTNDTADRSG